ncbi:hypothetical protein [Streptomyces indiaensis]|uniref:Uncharacterized protein n=1 Tax=Streptomyces indiaensis TaxID=284033 RepID=A0ABN3D6C3_9ACTN
MRVFVDRYLCHGSAEYAHWAPSVLASADGHRVVRPGRAGHERSSDDPSVVRPRRAEHERSSDDPSVVRPRRAEHERSSDDPSVPEAMKTCPSQAIGITGAPKSAPHRP